MGDSLVEPNNAFYPQSIHQKYWIEAYRDIYAVNLVKKDWHSELQKIIDLQPAPVQVPTIVELKQKNKIKTNKVKTQFKSKRFRRQGGKKSKSL